ncbi:MAG: hypothetical protein CM15mP86_19520 [Gammaproteobacteria bacterium]|nr:MAG: hypothetical protein CM15mP86_19520 [Gammaproteobacteria bacterium]
MDESLKRLASKCVTEKGGTRTFNNLCDHEVSLDIMKILRCVTILI